jgi:hypothetical protein
MCCISMTIVSLAQAASVRVDKPQAPVAGVFDTIGELRRHAGAVHYAIHAAAGTPLYSMIL